MKNVKIAVLNYSGNVGKTTIAKHLLLPRMSNAKWLPVESINEGGDAAVNFKGKEFAKVLNEVMSLGSVVVDIGSSNIEQVFVQLKTLKSAHEEFDFFIVPTVPAEKQQADTAKIIADLLDMDVEPEKIKVVFNQVPHDDDPVKVFKRLTDILMPMGVLLDSSIVMRESEIYSSLAKNQTIDDAIASGRDFKTELDAETDMDKRRAIASDRIHSRMAKGVKIELDAVFKSLFQ